ncbi:MAG TPA: amidohydrolase family protein [Longimicrobium sp.]|uniref:amidohydrolase family protein n=1 Tax=Longimicrobium sp. TaxID=2029185 RepID=UPI002ED90322
MKRSILLVLLAACSRNPHPASVPSGGGNVIAITHVNVIPMTSDTVLGDMTVIVRGERIEAIGRAGRTAVPAGARVIDGRGRYLIPGLVDAHIHLSNRADIDSVVAAVLLAKGVTTAIELGGMGLPGDSARLQLRTAINAGHRPGPTLYIARAQANDSTMTREGGMRRVEQDHAAGYDLMKVYNRLSVEGYRGITLRAHQLGMPVVGHVVRPAGLEATLGSGQRGIVHMEEFLYQYFGFRSSDTLTAQDAKLDTAVVSYFARITAEAGTYVTPTFVTYQAMIAHAEDLDRELARPEVRYIPATLYNAAWIREKNERSLMFAHPRRLHHLRAGLHYQRLLLQAMHREGVPLLVGTDAPVAGAVPGFSVHHELQNLVELGLSPYEALSAGTRNAAAYLRKDDFGTVEAGRRADLLLLSSNPLDDIRNTRAIAGVMARGRWFDEGALAALLARSAR